MSSKNSTKGVTTKALREGWADARRAVYLMEREIERSFKKDPVGKEYFANLLRDVVSHLNDEDNALEKTEKLDLSVSLAGSNNFSLSTWEGKLAVIMPEYNRLLSEQGFEVTLVKKRRVIAQLVPTQAQETNEWPYVDRRRQA